MSRQDTPSKHSSNTSSVLSSPTVTSTASSSTTQDSRRNLEGQLEQYLDVINSEIQKRFQKYQILRPDLSSAAATAAGAGVPASFSLSGSATPSLHVSLTSPREHDDLSDSPTTSPLLNSCNPNIGSAFSSNTSANNNISRKNSATTTTNNNAASASSAFSIVNTITNQQQVTTPTHTFTRTPPVAGRCLSGLDIGGTSVSTSNTNSVEQAAIIIPPPQLAFKLLEATSAMDKKEVQHVLEYAKKHNIELFISPSMDPIQAALQRQQQQQQQQGVAGRNTPPIVESDNNSNNASKKNSPSSVSPPNNAHHSSGSSSSHYYSNASALDPWVAAAAAQAIGATSLPSYHIISTNVTTPPVAFLPSQNVPAALQLSSHHQHQQQQNQQSASAASSSTQQQQQQQQGNINNATTNGNNNSNPATLNILSTSSSFGGGLSTEQSLLSTTQQQQQHFSAPSFLSNLAQRDLDGQTPLHIAALKGDADICKMLLEYGMQPDVEDESELTPLDLANEAGNKDVAILLEKEILKKRKILERLNSGISGISSNSTIGSSVQAHQGEYHHNRQYNNRSPDSARKIIDGGGDVSVSSGYSDSNAGSEPSSALLLYNYQQQQQQKTIGNSNTNSNNNNNSNKMNLNFAGSNLFPDHQAQFPGASGSNSTGLTPIHAYLSNPTNMNATHNAILPATHHHSGTASAYSKLQTLNNQNQVVVNTSNTTSASASNNANNLFQSNVFPRFPFYQPLVPQQSFIEQRLSGVIILVGLPARGKTYFVRRVQRFLMFKGAEVTRLSGGDVRRDLFPHTSRANVTDEQADAISDELALQAAQFLASYSQKPRQHCAAVIDGMNHTKALRGRLFSSLCSHGVPPTSIVFIEVVLTDDKSIQRHIDQAVEDFMIGDRNIHPSHFNLDKKQSAEVSEREEKEKDKMLNKKQEQDKDNNNDNNYSENSSPNSCNTPLYDASTSTLPPSVSDENIAAATFRSRSNSSSSTKQQQNKNLTANAFSIDSFSPSASEMNSPDKEIRNSRRGSPSNNNNSRNSSAIIINNVATTDSTPMQILEEISETERELQQQVKRPPPAIPSLTVTESSPTTAPPSPSFEKDKKKHHHHHHNKKQKENTTPTTSSATATTTTAESTSHNTNHHGGNNSISKPSLLQSESVWDGEFAGAEPSVPNSPITSSSNLHAFTFNRHDDADADEVEEISVGENSEKNNSQALTSNASSQALPKSSTSPALTSSATNSSCASTDATNPNSPSGTASATNKRSGILPVSAFYSSTSASTPPQVNIHNQNTNTNNTQNHQGTLLHPFSLMGSRSTTQQSSSAGGGGVDEDTTTTTTHSNSNTGTTSPQSTSTATPGSSRNLSPNLASAAAVLSNSGGQREGGERKNKKKTSSTTSSSKKSPEHQGESTDQTFRRKYRELIQLMSSKYETMTEVEEGGLCFARSVNRSQLTCHNMAYTPIGRALAKLLMDIRESDKRYFLATIGETVASHQGRVGARNSPLTQNGMNYAFRLAKYLSNQLSNNENNNENNNNTVDQALADTTVLCSSSVAARDTIAPFVAKLPRISSSSNNLDEQEKMKIKAQNASNNANAYNVRYLHTLDDLNYGDCDGMSMAEAQEAYPRTMQMRSENAYTVSWPRGESVQMMMQVRLEQHISELEAVTHQNVVIVVPQIVAQALMLYFDPARFAVIRPEEAVKVEVPLMHVICLNGNDRELPKWVNLSADENNNSASCSSGCSTGSGSGSSSSSDE